MPKSRHFLAPDLPFLPCLIIHKWGLEYFALTTQFRPVNRKEIYDEWLPKTYKIDLPPEIWGKASLIQQKFREFLAPVVSWEEKYFRPMEWEKTLEMTLPVYKELSPINVTFSTFVTADRRVHLSLVPTERVSKVELLLDGFMWEGGCG